MVIRREKSARLRPQGARDVEQTTTDAAAVAMPLVLRKGGDTQKMAITNHE